MEFTIMCALLKNQAAVLFTEHVKWKMLLGYSGLVVCWAAKLPVLVLAVGAVWLLDFVTGFFHAWSTHTINSKKGQEGLVKILLYSVVIITAFVLDHSIIDFLKFFPTAQNFWDMHHPFVQMMAGFIVVNDSISIFENAGKMGVPVPKVIMKRLTDIKDNLNNA